MYKSLSLSVLTAFLLFFMVTLTGAQGTPNITQQVTYRETIKRFVTFDPAQAQLLSPLEKEGLSRQSETRRVTQSVDQQQNVSTRVVIENTDVYEPWMRPTRTILNDQNGLALWDDKNQVKYFAPHTGADLEAYNQLKQSIAQNGLLPGKSFAVPTAEQLAQLRTQGAVVNVLPGGKYSIQTEGQTMLYDPANLSVNRQISEQGRLATELYQQYTALEGRNVPSVKIEKTFETLDSGVCITRVEYILYDQYQINLPANR
jgi:hypothetical protein